MTTINNEKTQFRNYYFCILITFLRREKVEDHKDDDKPKLPKPTLGENSLNTSVFTNPFVQAELAKAAILEKHVKMVYVDFLLLLFV